MVMEVVVEMEEMETVAHDLTRLVVEGRPGTQARSRAGLDAFFRVRVLLALRVFGFWQPNTRCDLSEQNFSPQKSPSCAPSRFASRHLYQFQERSCCPPIPVGRYAAGYRGAIIYQSPRFCSRESW